MKVKKFEALDMPQALDMIRRELGPDAVILSTRKIRKSSGMFGLLGRPVIEVTAASDYDFHAKMSIKEKGSLKKEDINWPSARFESIQDDINKIREELTDISIQKASNKEEREIVEFLSNYSKLEEKIDAILQGTIENKLGNFPPDTVSIYKTLTMNRVEEPLALKLIEFLEKKNQNLSGSVSKSEIMRKIIESSIKTSGLIEVNNGQKVVALVGPTGVGKTTTIAKLAANFALKEKKKVGMITIDTYRIAAVEQIKTYAKIMEIPVEVALNESDMQSAIDNMKFKDIILIDTAGMSPHNRKQIFELKNILLKRSIDLETHLVLSLTTNLEDLFVACNKFKELDFKRILFTKFDETTSCGNILNLSLRTRMPISYITTGQNVPEDIITADGMKIAEQLLKQSNI